MTEVPTPVARAAAAVGFEVDRLLPGGWQQGAWVVHRNGANAVLKVHTDELDRVLHARAHVDRAVARGWPTPRWLAAERLEDTVYVLTEFVEGTRPAAFDDRVAQHFVEAYEIQRGLGDGTAWWGDWIAGNVFDDSDDLRAKTAAVFPRAEEIIALVDAIAARAAGPPPHERDLVHGNFNIANAVDDGKRIWLVDVTSIGPGPVVYDAAESILVAADQNTDRIWEWVASTGEVREFSICLASVSLSMMWAFARLDHLHEADARAPSIIRNLERALRFL